MAADPPHGTARLVDRAVGAYRARYRAEPEGVWFAPGRVNLIGEHTDYNGGYVLPFALGSGVAVAAGRAPADVLSVWSGQEGGDPHTVSLAALAPGMVAGWAAYPLGVAWSLAVAGHLPGGTRLAIDSSVPMGAGLSSSAALECAVGLALRELHDLDLPRPELVALASRAENEFVGAPTGTMDQSAALLCRAGHALLLDCRSGASEAVPLDPAAAGQALLIIDTGARHALTDGRYAARREACEKAARRLGVASLRHVPDDPAAIGRLAETELQRRARHVVTENRRVLAAAALLRRGALAEIGPMLVQSHASLRDDFEVSWPEADVAVEAAVSAGAAGARMMGGGFGGSVLALVPADQAVAVEAAVGAAYTQHGWRLPGVTVAEPSDAGRRLR
jgi:galactokinase